MQALWLGLRPVRREAPLTRRILPLDCATRGPLWWNW